MHKYAPTGWHKKIPTQLKLNWMKLHCIRTVIGSKWGTLNRHNNKKYYTVSTFGHWLPSFTLCDPIWHVISSSRLVISTNCYTRFILLTYLLIWLVEQIVNYFGLLHWVQKLKRFKTTGYPYTPVINCTNLPLVFVPPCVHITINPRKA